MDVSMDGLRLHLLSNYNALTRKLNKGMNESKTETTVDVYEIEGNMEVIRNCIVTLSFMSEDDENGFKELENPYFESFNYNDENNG
jgi:hypothetical protein